MSIDKNDIEKYIFDPKNPKQCKSYKLLLSISKSENLIYVSPDFIAQAYEKEILNESFIDKLWDKPDDFDKLNIMDKISLYQTSLSRKEYREHLYSIKIDNDKLIYNKIFSKFIDLHPYNYISSIFPTYSEDLLKTKLEFNPEEYSWAGYKEHRDTYLFNQNYHGHKVLFTNNEIDLNKANDFFDVSTIVVTTNYNLFFDIPKSSATGSLIRRNNINKNIKPIFLKKIEDVDLLLNVLEQDINKEKNKDIIKEEVSIIKSIEIENFFSIKNIKIKNLKDKKEIYILGENGDGKTLLLQAIAIALKGTQKDGQEKFREIKDTFDLNILDSSDKSYTADESTIYQNMFAYGANRNNNCQLKEDDTGYLSLFDNSLDLKDPIKWLQFLDYSENKNEDNIISTAQAKQLIKEILNSDVEIDINPSEVTFTEKGSIVEFDRLSAGYKGVITIICDMLVRLSENQPYVTDIKDYEGIVLIDEVELHLHPKWKYNFVKNIRETFPLIQFIFTTHSPTVILGASSEAVFYKIYKEDGEVCISNQIKNEGYSNNSLISSPLFDLKTITSRDFENKKVSSDDYIYEKIHKVVSKRIKENINIDEDEILKLIDEELDKI